MKTFIISLGGSLIVTKDGIQSKFLKDFRKLILEETKKNKRFFIITGGGITARNYIESADSVLKIQDEDRDWLGIHATRLNAHLVRTIFHDIAHPEIITTPTHRMLTNKKVIVASGWKPGWSTDYVATLIAHEYDIDTIINLSNIEYAYDKDPNKYNDAKKIESIGWPAFRKIVGDKWTPGLNMPFDPIASRKAEKLNLEVIITNGKNLKNLKKILNGEKAQGTVIK